MFNNRIFRTTDEKDFLRGPLLSAYLRFEMLIWVAIAVLTLLSAGGRLLLPVPSETPDSTVIPGLLTTFAVSFTVLLMFVAVWRFKKWGVYLLMLWTAVMIAGLVATLLTPPVDGLFLLALLGLIMARVMILLFEIRPKWSAFEWGLF